jgi:hypothetical protein
MDPSQVDKCKAYECAAQIEEQLEKLSELNNNIAELESSRFQNHHVSGSSNLEIPMHDFDFYDDDGNIDLMKWMACEEDYDEDLEFLLSTSSLSADEDAPVVKPIKRRRKKGLLTDEGYEQLDPRTSSWWNLYVVGGKVFETEKSHIKEWRNRFRVPRKFIFDFKNEAVQNNYFPNVEKPDACGRVGAPLILLLLLSFRCNNHIYNKNIIFHVPS